MMVDIKWKRKVQKYGTGLYISIPQEIVDAMGIQKGEDMEITVDTDHFMVRKAKQ